MSASVTMAKNGCPLIDMMPRRRQNCLDLMLLFLGLLLSGLAPAGYCRILPVCLSMWRVVGFLKKLLAAVIWVRERCYVKIFGTVVDNEGLWIISFSHFDPKWPNMTPHNIIRNDIPILYPFGKRRHHHQPRLPFRLDKKHALTLLQKCQVVQGWCTTPLQPWRHQFCLP